MKRGRAVLTFVASTVVVATSISTTLSASPPSSPRVVPAGSTGVIDLSNDLALPSGARVERLAAKPGDGFSELVTEENGGQYTFRLLASTGIESYRPMVQEAAD